MKKSISIILVLIILILMGSIGILSFFLVKGNCDSCKEIGELKNEVAGLSNKYVENNTNEFTNNIESDTNEIKQSESVKENQITNKIKTYNDLKGTYESQNININDKTDLEPLYISYRLILSKEGTFAYYCDDTDCHYVGYYVIENNKLILNSVVFTGNDPSASLSDKVIELTLDNDGTIKGEKNISFTKKSEIPREDTNIAKVIDSYMSGCTTSGKEGQGPWFSGLEN